MLNPQIAIFDWAVGQTGYDPKNRSGQVSTRSYYVAEVQPGKDRFACKQLLDQGFIVLMPTYERERMIHGAVRTVARPIFTGYLFVSWDEGDRWQAINGTHGVKGLILGRRAMVGPERLPKPVDPKYAAVLEAMCSDDKPLAEDLAKELIGQMVRVVAGPFALFNGYCESVERGVASLKIFMFGQETTYAAPASWLEALPAA